MLLITQKNVNIFLNVKQNKIKMKYLFGALLFLYFLLMGAWAYGQNYAISGLWVNQENEFLRIEPGGNFVRFTVVNKKIMPITQGEVFEVNKELRVVRRDTIDTYDLCFYIGNENMVICRPRSHKAWLWTKISDL